MTNPDRPDPSQHPRGTLAILLVYGLLFIAGWFGLFLLFLRRGPVGS